MSKVSDILSETLELSTPERCMILYQKLLSRDEDDNYIIFREIIENKNQIANGEKKVPDELSRKIDVLYVKYFSYLQELVFLLVREYYDRETFYSKLYAKVFRSDLLAKTDNEKWIMLFFLADGIKGLPYYPFKKNIDIQNEEFSEIIDKISDILDSAMSVMETRYSTRTEEVGHLYELAENLENEKEKIVFWTVVIGMSTKIRNSDAD